MHVWMLARFATAPLRLASKLVDDYQQRRKKRRRDAVNREEWKRRNAAMTEIEEADYARFRLDLIMLAKREASVSAPVTPSKKTL